MTVRLAFDARQRRDVLLMAKGGWLSSGRCANALIPARTTDAGGCAVYYETPVRLLPVSAGCSEFESFFDHTAVRGRSP
jgi:hypothetical protein